MSKNTSVVIFLYLCVLVVNKKVGLEVNAEKTQ
jgi:hypothetical protein